MYVYVRARVCMYGFTHCMRVGERMDMMLGAVVHMCARVCVWVYLYLYTAFRYIHERTCDVCLGVSDMCMWFK